MERELSVSDAQTSRALLKTNRHEPSAGWGRSRQKQLKIPDLDGNSDSCRNTMAGHGYEHGQLAWS